MSEKSPISVLQNFPIALAGRALLLRAFRASAGRTLIWVIFRSICLALTFAEVPWLYRKTESLIIG